MTPPPLAWKNVHVTPPQSWDYIMLLERRDRHGAWQCVGDNRVLGLRNQEIDIEHKSVVGATRIDLIKYTQFFPKNFSWPDNASRYARTVYDAYTLQKFDCTQAYVPFGEGPNQRPLFERFQDIHADLGITPVLVSSKTNTTLVTNILSALKGGGHDTMMGHMLYQTLMPLNARHARVLMLEAQPTTHHLFSFSGY